ncbi:DUF192 domain-containing protein [Flavobacteriaceae bacterium R38]|nr:DUF192 domain-containing protein [Flavobacteriaceae bacterium R38]
MFRFNISITLSLLAIFAVFLFSSCGNETKKPPVKVTQEISFKKEGTLELFNTDEVLIKALDIEIADNDYETETGLMHRKSMLENRGMLFIFKDEEPRFFYMKNTEISLDIIYINSELKIVSFVENAETLNEASLPSNFPAKYVLEINAGLVEKWGIKVGDSISFTRN